MKTTPRRYYTPRQGQIPVFVSDFLSISDPVLAFDRFMEGIDLSKYLKNVPEYITGRNRYNPVDMLKTVLFAFADNGYCSLRKLEDNCKVNMRYIYLMNWKTPSYRTFGYRKNVKGNKYRRQEEVFECEDCSGCPYASECKKTPKNRTVRINQELTAMHREVLDNLNSVHGALLRMNRSIQAEGTFGVMKYDRRYRRIVRRGIDSVRLEVFLVSIGHNLYKLCNKTMKKQNVA